MAVFDTLISDAASRFGLGSNAGPLVRETLNMIANAPGGIGGFLGKLDRPVSGPKCSPGSDTPTQRPCRYKISIARLAPERLAGLPTGSALPKQP